MEGSWVQTVIRKRGKGREGAGFMESTRIEI